MENFIEPTSSDKISATAFSPDTAATRSSKMVAATCREVSALALSVWKTRAAVTASECGRHESKSVETLALARPLLQA
jgi:hypothetical protein